MYVFLLGVDKLTTGDVLTVREGFVSDSQESKYEWLQNDELFDDFYAAIFTKLTQTEAMLQAEAAICMEVFEKTNKKEHMNILDAGCGDGRFCYEFKEDTRVAKVTGIDYSDKAIQWAKQYNPKSEFMVKDLKTIELEDKFDCVVLIEVLEHIHPNDVLDVLAGLARTVKPDGKVIISVPSDNLPVSKKHYQHFNRDSLTKTLVNSFSVKKILGYRGKLATKNYDECKNNLISDITKDSTSIIAICGV
jgi:2-polyprenyl-3-methyl-5-hydroxy-6-metoxy-1,4-benzoquinol methylase